MGYSRNAAFIPYAMNFILITVVVTLISLIASLISIPILDKYMTSYSQLNVRFSVIIFQPKLFLEVINFAVVGMFIIMLVQYLIIKTSETAKLVDSYD